jgi:3-hydroxyacyl-[acyl-carrier-protein] dehydratase
MRFLLIDRIEVLEPGQRAEGFKQIASDEEYFDDHFPGYPLVPGVLVLESLAQLGGRLVEASVRATSPRRVLPLLAKVDHAKFIRPVRPGDRLDLEVQLLGLSAGAARVVATARVGEQVVAKAGLMFAVMDAAPSPAGLTERQAADLAQWSDRVWQQIRSEPS